MERGIIWDTLVQKAGSRGPVGMCKSCKKSQLEKDAEACIAAAKAIGDEDDEGVEKLEKALDSALDNPSLVHDWCCMS